jgi:hypothetical protein
VRRRESARVLAKSDGSDSGAVAYMAGFVRRSGRDSNPRGFRLAVFKPDAPVRGAWTMSVKQARVGPRVMATVMAELPDHVRDYWREEACRLEEAET